jgi:GTP-binding protein
MNAFTDSVKTRFDFLSYAPIIYISAKTGQRVHTVIPTAAQVQEERLVRIPTSELNALVREAMLKHPPASHTGRRLKIYYGSQVRVDPPTFLFHVNDKELVHFSYERMFLEPERALRRSLLRLTNASPLPKLIDCGAIARFWRRLTLLPHHF